MVRYIFIFMTMYSIICAQKISVDDAIRMKKVEKKLEGVILSKMHKNGTSIKPIRKHGHKLLKAGFSTNFWRVFRSIVNKPDGDISLTISLPNNRVYLERFTPFTITVTNNTQQSIKFIQMSCSFPKKLLYSYATPNAKYRLKKKDQLQTLNWKIIEIPAQSKKNFEIMVSSSSIASNLLIDATLKHKNYEVHDALPFVIEGKPHLRFVTARSKSNIKVGDKITFLVKALNDGTEKERFKLKYGLSSHMKFINAQGSRYQYAASSHTIYFSGPSNWGHETLKPQQSIMYKIVCRAEKPGLLTNFAYVIKWEGAIVSPQTVNIDDSVRPTINKPKIANAKIVKRNTRLDVETRMSVATTFGGRPFVIKTSVENENKYIEHNVKVISTLTKGLVYLYSDPPGVYCPKTKNKKAMIKWNFSELLPYEKKEIRVVVYGGPGDGGRSIHSVVATANNKEFKDSSIVRVNT